jgi:hypothetical protein
MEPFKCRQEVLMYREKDFLAVSVVLEVQVVLEDWEGMLRLILPNMVETPEWVGKEFLVLEMVEIKDLQVLPV